MANELPFRLPARVEGDPYSNELFKVVDSEGYIVAGEMFFSEADAIVTALNGYPAMKEACEYIVAAYNAHTDAGARQVLRASAEKCRVALNLSTAKEGRDE